MPLLRSRKDHRQHRVEFDREELDTLILIVAEYLEGMEDAKQVMIEDTQTLATWDDFMETMQAHISRTMLIENLRGRLVDEFHSRRRYARARARV